MGMTTDRGMTFLIGHEGEVLTAYRDPVGIWTIGVGLTAASGVITPRAGMRITREESRRLLGEALGANYEPTVRRIMPSSSPAHALDGAVSFHFNTGAVTRASWVGFYPSDPGEVRRRLGMWNKAGGRVLAGLTRRRREEADVILLGVYPGVHASVPPESPEPAGVSAIWVVSVTPDEIEMWRASLRELGYDPGPTAGVVMASEVRLFQADHGLTVDAKIGRATLTAIVREVDAKRRAGQAGGGAAGGGVVAGGGEGAGEAIAVWVGVGLVVASLIVVAYLAYQYRDVIAARIHGRAPRLADWLRSF